jgi:hypothetical protein
MRARGRKKTAKIERNACAAVLYEIHAIDDHHLIQVADERDGRSNGRCADSESFFLATKKFSCSPPSRLNTARQGRISARIDYG